MSNSGNKSVASLNESPAECLRRVYENLVLLQEVTDISVGDEAVDRMYEFSKRAIVALMDYKKALKESAIPSATPAQSVPGGMWFFSFYCEDFDSVQAVRVKANAPREFTCGVTGISKASPSHVEAPTVLLVDDDASVRAAYVAEAIAAGATPNPNYPPPHVEEPPQDWTDIFVEYEAHDRSDAWLYQQIEAHSRRASSRPSTASTPRTDAALRDQLTGDFDANGWLVSADVARQLERELAAMTKLNRIHVQQLDERSSTREPSNFGNAKVQEQIDFAVEKEACRWGERLNWIHAEYDVDGSGTESGDALDVIEAEIRLALEKAREQGAKPSARAEPTEAMIDKALRARIPGGSAAEDWFMPHEKPKAKQNIRDVVRCMLIAVSDGGGVHGD